MSSKNIETYFLAVKRAVDEWNPYDLLPSAPNDVFDRESIEIAKLVNVGDPKKEIAQIVSNVFSSSYEPRHFLPEDCYEVARQIRKNIKMAAN